MGQAPPFRPLLTAGILSKISLEQCKASLLKTKTKKFANKWTQLPPLSL